MKYEMHSIQKHNYGTVFFYMHIWTCFYVCIHWYTKHVASIYKYRQNVPYLYISISHLYVVCIYINTSIKYNCAYTLDDYISLVLLKMNDFFNIIYFSKKLEWFFLILYIFLKKLELFLIFITTKKIQRKFLWILF